MCRLMVSKLHEVLRANGLIMRAYAMKQLESHTNLAHKQQLLTRDLSFEGQFGLQTVDARGLRTSRGRNANIYCTQNKESCASRKNSKPKLNDYLSFSPRNGEPKMFGKF